MFIKKLIQLRALIVLLFGALIYARVLVYAFTNVVGVNYSLANMAFLIVPFTLLNVICLIAFWQCYAWARDLAAGSAG